MATVSKKAVKRATPATPAASKKTTKKAAAPAASPVPAAVPAASGAPAKPAAAPATPAQFAGGEVREKKKPWVLVALAVVVVLVGAEITLMMQAKIARKRSFTQQSMVGKRGDTLDEPGKFWGPLFMRVDATGRLLMVDCNFNKILVWDAKSGNHITDITRSVLKNDDFTPSNVDADAKGNIYIMDRGHSQVTVVSPDYKPVKTWAAPGANEMLVGVDGNVYIVDGVQRDIMVCNADGQVVSRFGKGLLEQPRHLDKDADGNLYVVDAGKGKMVVITPKGQLKTSFSLKGFKPLGNPQVAVRGDKIYLSEHENQKMLVFTLAGKLLWEIQRGYPEAMHVDDQGLVYMAGPGGIYKYIIE